MKRILLAALILVAMIGGSALADYVYRDANGAIQTFFAFTCLTTKNCSAQVLINSAGTEKATVGNPLVTASLGATNITPTDCSGTITAGGTAQIAIAANASLHGLTIANIDTVTGSGEPLWISFTGTAAVSAAGSYPLAAPTATTFAGLASYTTPLGFGSNADVSVIGATTGHKYSCTMW